MDNELLLFDRLEVIKTTIQTYGEENFYISFSGGKDSTVVHHLVDMALPDNKIPRVFINTGIEYNEIVKFVKKMADNDERFVLIKPSKPIKETLEKYGYPFKSKEHSQRVYEWKAGGRYNTLLKYFNQLPSDFRTCPKSLMYQIGADFNLKISNKCCMKLKKEPMSKYEKKSNRFIAITGMTKEEGGQRRNLACIITDSKTGNVKRFHPLSVITKENLDFIDWYIKTRNIELCELYYPPYNFQRTGCKGCPFSLDLQTQLYIMSELLPTERKQCEIIWEPVYTEYRRVGYRLKPAGLFDSNFIK